MARLLAFLPLLLSSLAYAQSTAPEAAQEPMNTVAVIGFLVLFIGSIVGFFIYIWWENRGKKTTRK